MEVSLMEESLIGSTTGAEISCIDTCPESDMILCCDASDPIPALAKSCAVIRTLLLMEVWLESSCCPSPERDLAKDSGDIVLRLRDAGLEAVVGEVLLIFGSAAAATMDCLVCMCRCKGLFFGRAIWILELSLSELSLMRPTTGVMFSAVLELLRLTLASSSGLTMLFRRPVCLLRTGLWLPLFTLAT